MYNWSTDTKELKKNSTKHIIWKLESLINFGLNGKKINRKQLAKHLPSLHIDPQKRNFLNFLLGKWNRPKFLPKQLLFLDLFSDSNLTKNFYLSGGTALTGFYIPYRYSEDLDFFCENEFDIQAVVIFLKSIKNKLNYCRALIDCAVLFC